jgi:predicted permease
MGSAIIIHQLLIFGVLMVVGALGSYFEIIKDEAKDFLSRFIIDITLPCLIFSTFAKIEGNSSLLINGAIVFGFTFINLAVALATGTISSKLQGLNPASTTVHSLHTMFGNIVFLGYPLFDALFPGGVGIFYAAAYQLASNSITFTYGIYRLSSGQKKSGLKSLLNINTFALLIGFSITAFGIKIPTFLIDALSGLGKATSPLSMVYIGALLMGIGIRQSVKHKSIYILSFNKLILLPILLGFGYLWIFKAFNLHVSREAFVVLVMQMAMPCQTIIVVMSRRYGGNYQLAAGNLFVSTILSIATLPAIFFYLNYLLG